MRIVQVIGATALLVALGVSAVALGRDHGSRGLTMRTAPLPSSPPGPTSSFAANNPAVVWSQWLLATDRLGGHVYLALGLFGTPSVFTVDVRSGQALRRTDVGSAVAAVVSDPPTGRVLLLQPWSTALGVLDARTVQPLRSVALGYQPSALAADAHTGLAYATGLDALFRPVLSIVDVRANRLSRTVPGGVSAMAADDGRIILLDGGSGAAIIDARTGDMMRTVVVSGGIDAVAVAAGRVLILDQTPALVTPSDPWGWVPAGVRERLPGMPRRASAYMSSGSFTTIDLPTR